MSKRPLQVGITGGIGAGKSVVCKILKVMGVPVYDADSAARWLQEHDTKLVEQIKDAFGEEAYQGDKLNREFLGQKVFGDEAALKQLNSLVHPRVAEHFDHWVSEQQTDIVVKEAALLIEAGSYKTLDYLVLVTAPKAVRIKRTLMRDTHRTLEQVKAIIERQMPESEKKQYADFTIANDEKSLLIPKVEALYRELEHLSKRQD